MSAEIDLDGFFLQLDSAAEAETEGVLAAVGQAGEDVVEFARSTTGEMLPPARKGKPSRQAHPGGWGDVKKKLSKGYESEASAETADRIELTVSNTAPHAHILEAHDDLWVVSGLAEGGHIQKAVETRVQETLDQTREV